MKKVIYGLASAMLLTIILLSTSAESKSWGVSVGDYVKYSVTVSGNLPPEIEWVRELGYLQIQVMEIEYEGVRVQRAYYFKNGTIKRETYFDDEGSFIESIDNPFFEIANISEIKEFNGVKREVICMSIGYEDYNSTRYYDKQTGFLLEEEGHDVSRNYFIHIRVSDTNLWWTPEKPNQGFLYNLIISIVIAALVIISLITIILLKKRKIRNEQNQTTQSTHYNLNHVNRKENINIVWKILN
jgi:hypothetical protein